MPRAASGSGLPCPRSPQAEEEGGHARNNDNQDAGNSWDEHDSAQDRAVVSSALKRVRTESVVVLYASSFMRGTR